MTTFDIPTLATDRLRLRAFQASDLDAYASMQANPEVMQYLVDGRIGCIIDHTKPTANEAVDRAHAGREAGGTLEHKYLPAGDRC
jgi:RimJ/RimL family protein N-acetyltransferase